MEHFLSKDNYLHASSILDLDAVLDLIADYCVNDGAADRIRKLQPSGDRNWIEKSTAAAEEMRIYQDSEGGLNIIQTPSREAVESASRLGRTLRAMDLLSVALLERSIMNLQKKIRSRREDCPFLHVAVSSFTVHAKLAARIEKSIDDGGEVADGASALLKTIRRKTSAARSHLREKAAKTAAQYGDNSYSTLLDDRIVLLVPREKHRRGTGIIHAKSHSGGSIYFEPIPLVELNNSIETLLQDEKSEVERILSSLSSEVAEFADEIIQNISIMEDLDCLQARAFFAVKFKGIIPAITENRSMRLVKARHPLLEMSLGMKRESAGSECHVPLDIEIKPGEPVIVISGPNSGGKTVALKTMGLVVLMFQCGLHVPCAEGTAIPVFKKIFADIGDEQSIADSLSTFTSHLLHLDIMCRAAADGALCLIDEIGDGTDPDEGSALANAVLERLLDKDALVVATTHLGKVKTFALLTDGIGNASMLFDDKSQSPLFLLAQGIAGRSRGIETARRCGFDSETMKIVDHFLDEGVLNMETLLSELESSHIALEEERVGLEQRSVELKEIIRIYTEREKNLREMQAAHDERAELETVQLMESARKKIERIVKDIRESSASRDKIKEGQRRLSELTREHGPKSRPAPPVEKADNIKPGDRVSLHADGSPSGLVARLQNDTATVEIDGKRIKINIRSLYRLSSDSEKEPEKIKFDVEFEPLGSTSIDVRGREREEALEAVDRFIDRAVLSGVHELKIIHGVGGGVLLRAIHNRLKDDPRVKSIRLGHTPEGGAGVTFAVLA